MRPSARRDCGRRISGGMLAALFGLTCLPAFATDDASHARDLIEVQGNVRVDADTVRSHFREAAGGGFDDAARDAALKALFATGLFDDVRIERAGGRLIVRVSEAPLLDRVLFEGNRKIQDKDLSAVIASRPRGTLQRATVQSDVSRIVDAYRHAGRYEVDVVPQVIKRDSGRVDLIYVVTEGKRTPVQLIKFEGNRAFGHRQLAAIIKSGATHLLSFITGGDEYDPDRVLSDGDQLRRYYRSKGYADVSVPPAKAEYDPATRGFTLTFSIDEGPVYHFGEIGFASNVPGLDAEKLRSTVAVRTGALFDGTALDRTVETVANELAKRGYPFAQVEPLSTRDAASRRIDIVFRINQGTRAYVERINIHGNERSRDEVIRREIDLAEGDAYNKGLIERAERRLKNLNYFKSVKVSTTPGSSSDRVVLDVEVVEQSTGDFFISGGYSTTDGLLAEVKVGERNFLGSGKAINAAVTYGQYARSVNLSAMEPYFLGRRVAAGVELYGSQSQASPYRSYGSDLYGATLQLGTPLTEQLGMQYRYSLYNQSISLDPTSLAATPSLPIRQAALAGPAWVSAVGTTLTYSTLDNTKAPTGGTSSQLKQDLAGLGGDVRFLRTTEDLRHYHSINDDLVSLTRAQGGYITGWGGKQAPLMNTFFGGPTMVRGFAPNGFGPRDLTPGTTMDNVGGNMYWATTAELQSSIPGVPKEYGLKATAFVDAGTVFGYKGTTAFPGSTQSLQLAKTDPVRSAVGAGLTWASPFGALTVDYSFPLSKAAHDIVQPFRFSAGGF